MFEGVVHPCLFTGPGPGSQISMHMPSEGIELVQVAVRNESIRGYFNIYRGTVDNSTVRIICKNLSNVLLIGAI